MRLPSHHLDVGLNGTSGLDCLQDGDQIARPNAHGIEAIDNLLQGNALLTRNIFLPSSWTPMLVRAQLLSAHGERMAPAD